MRLYRLENLGGLDALKLTNAPDPQPGACEVVVRIRACSLNHRDLNIISGAYTSHAIKPAVIPLSDGAGEVTAIGAGVTRWKIGDRVAPIFVQRWIGGRLRLEYMSSALGGPSDGVAAESIVLSEEGLVRIPAHLGYEEAAALPCAAVTAWNAALVRGALQPGQTLVTLGTGGVSLFAAQFGLMTGARVIATTGSQEKVARLRALGVTDVIDSYAPHVLAGAKFTQGWGDIIGVMAYNSNWEEWSGKVRLDVNVNDQITLWVMGGYGTDDNIARQFYKPWGGNWAIWGGGTFKVNEKTSLNAQLSYDEDKNFGVAANVAYTVVPGLTATVEVDYINRGDSNWTGIPTVKDDAIGGVLRIDRSF